MWRRFKIAVARRAHALRRLGAVGLAIWFVNLIVEDWAASAIRARLANWGPEGVREILDAVGWLYQQTLGEPVTSALAIALGLAVGILIVSLVDTGSVDGSLELIKQDVVQGTDNIAFKDVERVVSAGRTNDLLQIALDQPATNVKRKQVASHLVRMGLFDEALVVTTSIPNNAEARQVGERVVDTMDFVAPDDGPEWKFLKELYSKLQRTPNHRMILLERMVHRGVLIRAPWNSLLVTEEPTDPTQLTSAGPASNAPPAPQSPPPS